MTNLAFSQVEDVTACASVWTAVGAVAGVALVIIACD
jgi:hypothetical protein